MSCCGQRRRAHKAWLLARPVSVRYLATEPIRAVGQVTGNFYEFSSATPELYVDARDVAALLGTASFARVDPRKQEDLPKNR